jgi:hypothetical protein
VYTAADAALEWNTLYMDENEQFQASHCNNIIFMAEHVFTFRQTAHSDKCANAMCGELGVIQMSGGLRRRGGEAGNLGDTLVLRATER